MEQTKNKKHYIKCHGQRVEIIYDKEPPAPVVVVEKEDNKFANKIIERELDSLNYPFLSFWKQTAGR